MSTPILATKLYIPRPRHEAVLRPRLIERLNEGLQRKLTLISAPAGFGKTTLASAWVATCGRPAAWLSLDEGDNDPRRFLAYLVAALQTAAPEVGSGAMAALQSPQPPPAESILTALLNQLAAIPDAFALVLDDYHVLEAEPIDNTLTFLLEHLPPQLHLVIATREDPRLPLSRLRARGQMTELRASDLRFTPSEAAIFLNDAMGLDLSAGEVASLETRTEGWIVGLQLAALSMQGREDVSGFIAAFAGDNRYIVDYLVEEVLQRQPARIRSFLLQTSILRRLSGSLCDAVTGQEEGAVLLEALERGNLFVVPLDDRRHWFRYHQLFADVLHAHLMKEQPDRLPVLHRRASEWYEQNGSPASAVRHALAGEDFERAAALVELAWPAMEGSFQTVTWLGWVKALPAELVRARPVLSAGYAWALLNHGKLEAAETRLQDAEEWLRAGEDTRGGPEAPLAEMVVVDEDQFRTLPASIATARAYLAQTQGNVLDTVQHGRRALDLLPEGDHLQRGIVGALLGVAYWTNGDLEAAHRTLADGMAHLRSAGNILFAIRGTYVLADIRLAQGRLRDAISIYEQSLQLAAEQGEQVLRGTADLHVRLSELHREQNNTSAATQHLLKSEELGEQAASPHWPYRLCLAQARIQQARGELDAALKLLDEAERLYIRGPVPDLQPIAALKARVRIAQGKLDEALRWVREESLSADDDLDYLREFEHITLARVLIASYRRDQTDDSMLEAQGLLARLLNAAEAGGRMGSALEILVLQALAHEAHGNIPAALAPLERALAFAEPEGYARIFVDEGMAMARLLS
ncbi:MAG: helix-turn-helix transcriptional regulator, partial [Caldilineaceae bacterium]|nr:helix-turn-helix transcriptional regulator [Caldilineaceae bacterium]